MRFCSFSFDKSGARGKLEKVDETLAFDATGAVLGCCSCSCCLVEIPSKYSKEYLVQLPRLRYRRLICVSLRVLPSSGLILPLNKLELLLVLDAALMLPLLIVAVSTVLASLFKTSFTADTIEWRRNCWAESIFFLCSLACLALFRAFSPRPKNFPIP